MQTVKRRPVFRSFLATVALAAGLIVAAPGAAHAETCHWTGQNGMVVTIAGVPTRVPTVWVGVCVSHIPGTSTLPVIEEVNQWGENGCLANCYAVVVHNPSQEPLVVSIETRFENDDQVTSVPVPLSGGAYVCAFGYGWPQPPVNGCLISIDPD